MSCETCTNLKDVIRCNSKVSFGTYATADTSIVIYFKDLGTDKITRFEMDTAPITGGIVLTHGFSFRNGQTYKVWLNESGANMETMEQWTLTDATTTLTCGLVRFMDVFDSNGDREVVNAVTLTA